MIKIMFQLFIFEVVSDGPFDYAQDTNNGGKYVYHFERNRRKKGFD